MLWTLTKFTTIDLALSFTAIKICYIIGVKGGNASSRTIMARLMNDPGEAFWSCCIVAPIVEELMFRWFPCFLIWLFYSHTTHLGIHWGWGFWTSLIFALVHGIENDNGEFVLPLPQFFAGLLFWYLARTHGIMSAICVHSLSNAVGLFFAML